MSGVCFFMVFGALIEYACVGYTAKRIQLRKNRSELIISLIWKRFGLLRPLTFLDTNNTLNFSQLFSGPSYQ